jgi:hypothetical protein
MMTTSFALEAMQMFMRTAPAGCFGYSLLEQRLVLAPWLALTERCLLGQARLLSTLKALPLPADLTPLLTCFQALVDCLERLHNVLNCWDSGFSSSNSRWGYRLTLCDFTPQVLLETMGQLGDHLRANTALVDGVSCAAVAAASAAAASTAGYLPAYSDLQDVWGRDFNNLQEHLTEILIVLMPTQKHASHLQGLGLDGGSSSSSSSSGSYSDGSSAAVNVGGDMHKRYHHSDVTIQLLEQLGLSLCDQLPMPWLCNNPRCSNLSVVSELQLVGGKACVCGGCRLAR